MNIIIFIMLIMISLYISYSSCREIWQRNKLKIKTINDKAERKNINHKSPQQLEEEIHNHPDEEPELVELEDIKRREFPYLISDMIGQEDAKALLKMNLFNHRFAPVLYGKPGTGKSLLCELYAIERNRVLFINGIEKLGSVVRTQGGSLSLYKVAELVMQLDENDVLFIDELHRMSMPIAEQLLNVIQDYILYGVEPERFMTRAKVTVRKKYLEGLQSGRIQKKGTLMDILVPESVVICGATTELGLVPKPLHDRMYPIRLKTYSDNEMRQLLICSYSDLNFEPGTINLVVENSQQIPRLAKRIINALNPDKRSHITMDDIKLSLKFLELEKGLTYHQQKYLSFLFAESPVGRKTITDYLGIPLNELDYVVEPWLKECGWVKVSSKGRELTKKGEFFCQHVLFIKSKDAFFEEDLND